MTNIELQHKVYKLWESIKFRRKLIPKYGHIVHKNGYTHENLTIRCYHPYGEVITVNNINDEEDGNHSRIEFSISFNYLTNPILDHIICISGINILKEVKEFEATLNKIEKSLLGLL